MNPLSAVRRALQWVVTSVKSFGDSPSGPTETNSNNPFAAPQVPPLNRSDRIIQTRRLLEVDQLEKQKKSEFSDWLYLLVFKREKILNKEDITLGQDLSLLKKSYLLYLNQDDYPKDPKTNRQELATRLEALAIRIQKNIPTKTLLSFVLQY